MKALFICSGNTNSAINPIIQRQGDSLIQRGIEVTYFTINGKGFKGYYNSIGKLKSFLKQNQFDILHAHYALCGYVAYFGSKNQKRVLSFMGTDLLGERRAGKGTGLSSRLMTWFNKMTSKLFFDKIIVKSEEMREELGVSEKTVLIPNGVNLSVFRHQDQKVSQQSLRFDPEKSHVIFVANPGRAGKNFQLAQNAFDLLDQSKYELHKVFDLPTEQLVQYYNAADVVLMTSFYEGSPNVIKEALACGCPIVSTNVGDVEYLLKDVEGCFVTDHHAETIKRQVEKAVEFRKNNKATKGKERIRAIGLDSESIADKLIGVYNSLLKS